METDKKQLVKKTFNVSLENAKYLLALMANMNFKEVDRVSTGGMQSAPELLLTFEGYEEDYNENQFIAIPPNNKYAWMGTTYYSVVFPNGVSAKDNEEYIQKLNAYRTSEFTIETLVLTKT